MREDMRAAFLANFADDGMLARSGWIVSNDWMRGRPAPAIALEWTVERVETARSGEFGYARGRYSAVGAPQTALGWFMRVWRQERDGWRIVLDVTHPAPAK